MHTISRFYFDKAKYRLTDALGNEVLMAIDYKNARFRLREVTVFDKENMAKLRSRVNRIATDLIRRKHDVNFSGTIKA